MILQLVGGGGLGVGICFCWIIHEDLQLYILMRNEELNDSSSDQYLVINEYSDRVVMTVPLRGWT